MSTVLAVKDLSVVYKNKNKRLYAVNHASFNLLQGESLGVVGESGSGKTTLAMAILRLLPAHTAEVTGSIDFIGRSLLDLDDKELSEVRWSELAIVFQKSMNSLSPVHRIGEQISDIYRVHEPNATKEQTQERIYELFALVGLSDRTVRLYPHELSGGMLQRVSIATALLHSPRLLIMDEATTALDVVTQGQILEEIKEMEKSIDITRMMITHDMSVVATTCTHIAVMYAGDIVEVGPCALVLKNPKHPYTEGLLQSFPSLRGEKKALKGIEGYLPDLSVRYESCSFAPRCQYAKDCCFKEKPQMSEIQAGWTASCLLH